MLLTSIMVVRGPASTRVKSRTLIPANGRSPTGGLGPVESRRGHEVHTSGRSRTVCRRMTEPLLTSIIWNMYGFERAVTFWMSEIDSRCAEPHQSKSYSTVSCRIVLTYHANETVRKVYREKVRPWYLHTNSMHHKDKYRNDGSTRK